MMTKPLIINLTDCFGMYYLTLIQPPVIALELLGYCCVGHAGLAKGVYLVGIHEKLVLERFLARPPSLCGDGLVQHLRQLLRRKITMGNLLAQQRGGKDKVLPWAQRLLEVCGAWIVINDTLQDCGAMADLVESYWTSRAGQPVQCRFDCALIQL